MLVWPVRLVGCLYHGSSEMLNLARQQFFVHGLFLAFILSRVPCVRVGIGVGIGAGVGVEVGVCL